MPLHRYDLPLLKIMIVAPIPTVEATLLFKLRLMVARYGEMDLAGWWNTNGVLGKLGNAGLSRGFPVIHSFAQARIVFAVASARCKEVFNATGCYTLWSLSPETEEIMDAQWHSWCQTPDTWTGFFNELSEVNSNDLREQLFSMKLIDGKARAAVAGLTMAPQSRVLLLPITGQLDDHAVMLLAAGFARGSKGQLAIPYMRAE